MMNFMTATFFFIISFVVYGYCQNQITVNVPSVYVKKDEDATVPCTYTTTISRTPVIKWYRVKNNSRDLVYTYDPDDIEKSGPGGDFTSEKVFVGNDNSLMIFSTTLADNDDFGTLVCEVNFGQPGLQRGRGSLTVVVLASTKPTVQLRDNMNVFDQGKQAVGTCTSGSGYPVPTIKFYRGSEEIIKDEKEEVDIEDPNDLFEFNENFILTRHPDGTMEKQQTLTYNLTREDNGIQFSCVVISGEGGESTTQKQAILFPPVYVNYPTDMVQFVDPPSQVFENEEFTLTCQGNGYPNPTITINGAEESETVIIPSRNDDGAKYICSGYNSDRIVEDEFKLDVYYADEPVVSGRKQYKNDEKIHLTCTIVSKPKPQRLIWKKGSEIISDSGTLMFAKATFENSGEYKCVAENSSPQLMREKSVDVKVTGFVFDDTTVEVDGEPEKSTELKCDVTGYPAPKFSWTRKAAGAESKMEKVTDFTTSNRGDNYSYVSIVKIDSLQADMSKMEYYCEVKSENSTARKTFSLPELVQGASPAGIIIGILIAIVVIAVILAILYNKGYICSKKKGDQEAEDIAIKMEKGDVEDGSKSKDVQHVDNAQNEENERTELMNGTDQQQAS